MKMANRHQYKPRGSYSRHKRQHALTTVIQTWKQLLTCLALLSIFSFSVFQILLRRHLPTTTIITQVSLLMAITVMADQGDFEQRIPTPSYSSWRKSSTSINISVDLEGSKLRPRWTWQRDKWKFGSRTEEWSTRGKHRWVVIYFRDIKAGIKSKFEI